MSKRSVPSHLDEDAEEILRTLRTPTTPSDAGHVSDESDLLSLNFVCTVYLSSGRSLASFKCDESTEVGDIKRMVRNDLWALQSKGELSFVSFELCRLRGMSILRNNSSKLYEQRDPDNEDCFLTVVLS